MACFLLDVRHAAPGNFSLFCFEPSHALVASPEITLEWRTMQFHHVAEVFVHLLFAAAAACPHARLSPTAGAFQAQCFRAARWQIPHGRRVILLSLSLLALLAAPSIAVLTHGFALTQHPLRLSIQTFYFCFSALVASFRDTFLASALLVGLFPLLHPKLLNIASRFTGTALSPTGAL